MALIKNPITQAFDMLSIDTVAPTLALGEIPVSADRRSTEKAPLTDAERIRRVTLPAGTWGNIAGSIDGAPVQGLTDVLLAGLRGIACERLKDYLAEQPLARTVALADYSVSALLSWSAETAATRGSLTFTREQVEAWFPGSKLAARYVDDKARFAFVKNRLATLAAKNHGLKKADDADKLIVLLADDSTDPLAIELIQRLTHISKQFSAKKADDLIDMDSL